MNWTLFILLSLIFTFFTAVITRSSILFALFLFLFGLLSGYLLNGA